MSFAWPLALLSLLLVPALLGVYWWSQRRRRKQAVRYSSVALLRSVLPARKRWQRHLPVALLLLGLAALAFAAGRPQMTSGACRTRARRSSSRSTSPARCARPTSQPNRLAVAQEAARKFVENQPKGVRMGLVVFSGFAELTVPPTTDRKALDEAIEGLTTGHGTAIGSAMLKGLDAIAESNPAVAAGRRLPRAASRAGRAKPGANGFVPDIVVLLTDGANNRGIEPLDAVPVRGRAPGARVHDRLRDDRTRRRRRARASSSAATSSTRAGSAAAAAGSAAGGGFGGFLVADAPTLKAVAERTGGTYHSAKDADQLRKVFTKLPKEVATQKRPTEITWWFAALGALLAAGAVARLDALEPVPLERGAAAARDDSGGHDDDERRDLCGG